MVRRSPSLHANLGNFFTLKKGQAPHHKLDNPQQKGFCSGIPSRKLSVKFFLSWAKWVSFQAPHPSRKVMKLETAASGVQFFRLIYLLWCSVSTTSSHDINNNQISFFFHDHMACHSYCWLRLAESGNQAGGEWILKKPLLSRSFFGAVHVLIYSSLSTVICRHRPESW